MPVAAIASKVTRMKRNLWMSMDRSTSWARAVTEAETVPVAACPAAKFIAARVVLSHRRDETDAEADLELSAATRPAPDSATPRRVKLRRSLSHARANRLRTVPAGHRSRCAASSRVSPSK